MKKITFLLAFVMTVLFASASITVCDVVPDANGHFDCPFIKSGSITWDQTSRTLTLDNAVVEHSSDNAYDFVYPVRVTEDATIVIHGDCKLTTTGYVAMALDGYNSKSITIQGDGSLYLDSKMRGIYLICTQLTIKDITLQAAKHIANNGNGVLVALTFDNVSADIQGGVDRIGQGITLRNCAITYPEGALILQEEYGYYIANGDGSFAQHIIISRGGNKPGDVNGDGEINIADVNAVIDMILSGGGDMSGDVNGDKEVNIADVNALIDMILNPVKEHEWVDLGLPSGTLWATMNVGANSPEDYGAYYAWGETAPKDEYFGDNYKWYNQREPLMISKYNTSNNYGTVDNKIELDPADDAAYLNWGSSWRMPTKEQQDELVKKCTWQWTTRNGVNGSLVTGPNGNTLFLPANGYRYKNSLYSAGSRGYYWSRTLDSNNPSFAFFMTFNSESGSWLNNNYRYWGRCVRAVRVP